MEDVIRVLVGSLKKLEGTLVEHKEVYTMALEGIKPSSYHNDAGLASTSRDAVGNKNVGMMVDFTNDTSQRIQPVEENNVDYKEINEKFIKSEISKVNSRIKRHNIKCKFDYHDEINRITIKIMDKDTEEVIREIPPEKTLDMIQKMWELAGLLIDERR